MKRGYKRRIYRKRRFTRSKRGVIRKSTAYKIATRVLRKNIEKKCYDVSPTESTVSTVTGSTAGGIDLLQGLDGGTARNNRVGDKISLQKIWMRWDLKQDTPTVNNTTNYTCTPCRCIIYQWLDNSDMVGPTIGDILQVGTDINSPWKWEKRGTYQILYDQTHYIDTNINVKKTIEVSIKPKTKTIRYNSSTNSGGHAHIFFACFTGNVVSTGTASTSKMKLNYRVLYTDA